MLACGASLAWLYRAGPRQEAGSRVQAGSKRREVCMPAPDWKHFGMGGCQGQCSLSKPGRRGSPAASGGQGRKDPTSHLSESLHLHGLEDRGHFVSAFLADPAEPALSPHSMKGCDEGLRASRAHPKMYNCFSWIPGPMPLWAPCISPYTI